MAAILKSVGVSENSSGIYTLTLLLFGEERKYLIDEGTYREIGCPLSEHSLDDGVVSLIELCDGKIRCFRRAVRMLEYSDKSESALRARLRSLGFSSDAIDFATGECKRLSYLNEDRTLEILIERLANRDLFGPYKIMARLAARGYRTGDIRRVLSALIESGEIDLDENKEKMLRKNSSSEDYKFSQRLLYKYGYKR